MQKKAEQGIPRKKIKGNCLLIGRAMERNGEIDERKNIFKVVQ